MEALAGELTGATVLALEWRIADGCQLRHRAPGAASGNDRERSSDGRPAGRRALH